MRCDVFPSTYTGTVQHGVLCELYFLFFFILYVAKVKVTFSTQHIKWKQLQQGFPETTRWPNNQLFFSSSLYTYHESTPYTLEPSTLSSFLFVWNWPQQYDCRHQLFTPFKRLHRNNLSTFLPIIGIGSTDDVWIKPLYLFGLNYFYVETPLIFSQISTQKLFYVPHIRKCCIEYCENTPCNVSF